MWTGMGTAPCCARSIRIHRHGAGTTSVRCHLRILGSDQLETNVHI